MLLMKHIDLPGDEPHLPRLWLFACPFPLLLEIDVMLSTSGWPLRAQGLRARMMLSGLACLALSGGLSPHAIAETPSEATQPSCAPEGGLSFICGIGAPEDLTVIPGTTWIVSGSFVPDASGGLYAIDTAHPALTRLYPLANAPAHPDLKTYPDCQTPPDPAHFATLGLSARPRAGAGATLYVVGHGGRESIEVFEIATASGTPKATWIGCVLAPAGATLNGVAGMFPGEILTTAIFEAPSTFKDVMAGKVTGNVYARVPGQGFKKLPGTALSGDNGMEVTRDHHWMFVVATGTKQLLRYDRTDMTKPPTTVNLTFGPDNVRWAPDGRLLVAGGERGMCAAGETCPGIANITAVDPVTLMTSVVARFPVTPHWSGLSGVAIVGNTLWLGSHQGDRIAYRVLKP